MPSQTHTPLSRLKESLDDLEYAVYLEPVTQENLFEKLFISLEVPDQPSKRQFIIEFFFVNDVLQAFGSEDDDDDAMVGQFALVLPLVVPKQANVEVMRFCNLINRLVPLGAFGLSEADQAVYLRYSLATSSRAISEAVFLQVISAFQYLCQEYMPMFTGICTGTHRTDGFIDSFTQSGHTIPSVGNPTLLGGE